METSGRGQRGIRVALVSLYHYGAFGTRILRDLLRTHGHEAFNIYFKQDKINEMWLPTEAETALLIAELLTWDRKTA